MNSDNMFRFHPENETEKSISDCIDSIRVPEERFRKEASEYADSLCKPLGSLGKLEEIYIRLYSIFRGDIPDFKKCVLVFASDNGVVSEGVTRNPQDTTYKVCMNILNNGSGLSKIAQFYETDVFLEDIGVIRDVKGHTDHKVLRSTGNIRYERAMTREDALRCLIAGMECAKTKIRQGYNLIGAGEMGVGNTTTSAALISVLTDNEPQTVTGYGSGITDSDLKNKIEVIQDAIRNNGPFTDILDVLGKISGGDIIAMAGVYLQCAIDGIPFVTDGVISVAAFLAASMFSKKVSEFAFLSHRSTEPGFMKATESLDMEPILDLKMRLGEGSGCPAGMNMMELSVFTLENMAGFRDVDVKKTDYIDIRRNNNEENT